MEIPPGMESLLNQCFQQKNTTFRTILFGGADPTCEFKKVQVESCLEFVLAILTCLTKNRPEENQYLCYFEKCNLPFRLSMFSPPKMPCLKSNLCGSALACQPSLLCFPIGAFLHPRSSGQLELEQVNLNWSLIFHYTGWLIS